MARMPTTAPIAPAAGATPDPTMGAGAGVDPGADPGADDGTGGGDTVILTVTQGADGSYTVYPGDEPDAGGMSDDDADAMGGAGGLGGASGGPQGVPADSIGAVLKAAMDILNTAKSSEGGAGNADDQFSAGFTGSQSPTPASGPKQKY